ncbi:MAG: ferrous iron transporter B, partial [Bdellovibrionales bacterium]|nr:ferrous iron transporter B [Bdellovibrionales bacterium]
RSFLPLLSSYACNVPGIMGARTIESKADRVITTLIIPLTTCSARIPVYGLLISAFVPNVAVFWGLKLQGIVMLGLYAVGICFAFLMGGIFKRVLFRGKRPPLLMELPSYKRPSLRSLVRGLLYRIQLFLKRVGTVILFATVVIWFLLSYPKDPVTGVHLIEQSYAAQIGHWIEPVLRPIGFDWRISMALIPTFAAREVMVGTLSTVYSIQEGAAVSDVEKLSLILKNEWSLATGMSLLVWFIFAPMCVSTLATARRELKSTPYMILMVLYLFALAYMGAFIAYRTFL